MYMTSGPSERLSTVFTRHNNFVLHFICIEGIRFYKDMEKGSQMEWSNKTTVIFL